MVRFPTLATGEQGRFDSSVTRTFPNRLLALFPQFRTAWILLVSFRPGRTPPRTHYHRQSTGTRLSKTALPLNRSPHITLPDVGFSVLFELAVERLAIYAKEVCGFLLFAFGEL